MEKSKENSAKCLACNEEIEEQGYCWSCYQRKGECRLKRKDFRLLSKLVEKIFEFYPKAVITGFFLGGDKCIIHFRALGGHGSDSIHVKANGEVWQCISGDLDICHLYELEEALRNIINPIVNISFLFR